MQRLLTRLAFLVFVGGTVAAVVRAGRSEFDDTASFGQADLQAWLTSPQPDSSPAVRRRAARQLDRDFHDEFDWQPTFDALPPDGQATFSTNFQSLLTVLIEQRADAYRAEPQHRRERFLDRQLQELASWYVVSKNGKSSGAGLFQQGLMALGSREAQSRMSPKVREFLGALQGHLVKRTLGRVSPFGNADRGPK